MNLFFFRLYIKALQKVSVIFKVIIFYYIEIIPHKSYHFKYVLLFTISISFHLFSPVYECIYYFEVVCS